MRLNKLSVTKLLLYVVYIGLVIVPIINLFINVTTNDLKSVIYGRDFVMALKNSIAVSIVSTILVIIFAYFSAYSIIRSSISFKSIFGIIFTLPMLIPSISSGMGLIILFGNNGIITKLIGFNIDIYGFKGIVLGSMLYAFPVAYLMFADIMRYENYEPYEACKVLGIDKLHTFTGITFPYMRKPLITIIFAIFSMIITDYGVPLMVGGKYITLPVIMYEEVLGRLNFNRGAVYGLFLLIPAVIAFVVDLINKDKGSNSFTKKQFELNNNKISSYLLCTILSIFLLLPILSFTLIVDKNSIVKMMSLKTDKYILNSIIIAIFVSIIGTVISFITAYITARLKAKDTKLLYLLSISSAAIPGIVLGLSYVLLFKGSIIYGTILILIIANIIHFISSPFLMMYNSMSKMNIHLEDIGHILGINIFNLIKDVFIPLCKGSIFEMFTYFFVNSMMTISAVSFLANANTKPLSLMINQFEAQMKLPCAAIVALIILVINLLIKTMLLHVKNSYIKCHNK